MRQSQPDHRQFFDPIREFFVRSKLEGTWDIESYSMVKGQPPHLQKQHPVDTISDTPTYHLTETILVQLLLLQPRLFQRPRHGRAKRLERSYRSRKECGEVVIRVSEHFHHYTRSAGQWKTESTEPCAQERGQVSLHGTELR